MLLHGERKVNFNSCIVKIISGSEKNTGTGFFVSSNVVMTCAHVVARAYREKQAITIHWQKKQATVIECRLIPEEVDIGTDNYPYPDIALLTLPINNNTFFTFSKEIFIGQELTSFGYTDMYKDGEPSLLTCEGVSECSSPLIKLRDSQIRPGYSGAPLIGLSNARVYGMIKKSRGRDTDLGGRAIPSQTLIDNLPENLKQNSAELIIVRTDSLVSKGVKVSYLANSTVLSYSDSSNVTIYLSASTISLQCMAFFPPKPYQTPEKILYFGKSELKTLKVEPFTTYYWYVNIDKIAMIYATGKIMLVKAIFSKLGLGKVNPYDENTWPINIDSEIKLKVNV
jgi:Trypsin-like peptidase domain